MATWTAFKEYDWFSSGKLSWYLEWNSEAGVRTFDDLNSTSTQLIITHHDGIRTYINGTGLTSTASGISWTTLTSVQHIAADNTVIEQINGFSAGIAAAHSNVSAFSFFQTIMAGTDTLTGSSGRDNLWGGDGTNTISGSGGADALEGGVGNDTIVLQQNDFVAGETINAGGSTNTLQLENAGLLDLRIGTVSGFQILKFASGTSNATFGQNVLGGLTSIIGSGGQDTITAIQNGTGSPDFSGVTFSNWTNGVDVINIKGNGNPEVIVGSTQDDIIDGGAGNDLLTGGAGDDQFVFAAGNSADTITDFVAGSGTVDRINLTAFSNLTLQYVLTHTTQVGSHAVIDFGGGDTLTLLNVNKATLNVDDFVGVTNLLTSDFDFEFAQ